jgi:hypothetical protein
MDNLSNRPERPRKTPGKGKQGKKSSFGRRIFPEKDLPVPQKHPAS